MLGKDERENAVLQALAAPCDWCMMLAGDIPGPLLIMEGTPELPVFEWAAALVKHYSRKRNEDEAMVFCCRKDKAADRTVRARTVAETELMRYYVG